MNCEFPDVQGGYIRQRNQRSNCQHALLDHGKSKRVPEKHLFLPYWLCQSLWLCITTNYGKFFKRWEYQTTWTFSWEICMQVRKQQLELYMEHSEHIRTWHGTTDWFQIQKGVHQGCILSPCLFNLYIEYIMRNAGLNEAQARIKISKRNINNLRYSDDTTLTAENEELESISMKVKKESEKVSLKLNIQKTKIMASGPITSWQIYWETMADFIFGGYKITADGDCSHEIKRRLLLGRKVITNLDSILKSRETTLPTKLYVVKPLVFPAVMYGCESWIVNKSECWRIDAFELWCWRRLFESPLDCKEVQPIHLKGN